MKRSHYNCFMNGRHIWRVVIVVLVAVTSFYHSSAAAETKRLKLLWIGSSSVSRLSRVVDRVISSSGDLETTSVCAGGYFRMDYIAADRAGRKTPPAVERASIIDVKKAIVAENYDFIVVQVAGRIFNHTDFPAHVPNILDEVCTAINESGAIPVIFEHWSRNPEEMRRICLEAGVRNGARVALCGSSADQVIQEKGLDYLLNALTDDKGHAGPNGNYLWACSVYAALTGKSPERLKAASIPSNRKVKAEDVESIVRKVEKEGNLIDYQHEFSKDDLAYLKKTAWDVHQRYLDQLTNHRDQKK